MEYILYLVIFLVLLFIFLVCIALALTIGVVVGVFFAYVRAAITYISSILYEIDNKGARIFMTTVSSIAIALPALFIIAMIIGIIASLAG